MNKQKELEAIEEAKRTGERLSFTEASRRLRKANDEGRVYMVVYHIADGRWFKRWANENGIAPESRAYEEERTYYGNSDQKAFKANMGGYSIFAQCEANIRKGDVFGIERIERLNFDYVVLIDLIEGRA